MNELPAWLDAVSTLLSVIALGSAAFSVAALVTALLKRWHSSRRMALLSLVAVLATMAGSVLLFVGGILAASGDATSKATILAMTISRGMNCTAIAIPSAVVAIPAWWVSRNKLRREKPES